MLEPEVHSRVVIPEQLMLSRLAQSEQMREFFIQMWIQNPALAKQGGVKVKNLLSPLAVADALIPHNPPIGLAVDIEGGGR
ncbi:MAG: hypothetical protein A3K04_01835 [Gallionellales bacterium RBG_16_56_9]|nr:MAG: hypothetical protein A3K04_01835 [Gallionellales bacterium RBG_16_56_9]